MKVGEAKHWAPLHSPVAVSTRSRTVVIPHARSRAEGISSSPAAFFNHETIQGQIKDMVDRVGRYNDSSSGCSPSAHELTIKTRDGLMKNLASVSVRKSR